MAIESAIIVPHPPLLVPEVGNGQEKQIQKTIDSYHVAAKHIASLKPETILVFSPHAPAYADYIHMASGTMIRGGLEQFGGETVIEASLDEELTESIACLCESKSFPAGTLGGQDAVMDHGTFVPLYFINQYYTDYRLLICSLSGLSRLEIYRFGMYIDTAVKQLDRRAVIVASGDLSHKLMESGPYRFAKEGPELDEKLTDIMKTADFLQFLTVDEKLCQLGAECGLGSFIIMSGALNQKTVDANFLSYEGPFGVGYAVCIFDVIGESRERNYYELFIEEKQERMKKVREGEDPYTRLARETLEYYVHEDRLMHLPENLPDEMKQNQSGAFVSIKKDGQLRGCIGTTEPTQENMAWEIMYNAISSGTRDPRFPVVQADELESLVYSVDILSELSPVEDEEKLDPKRFGVIVTNGSRRGLLLPNLDGVDTVRQQIEIACQKAGIQAGEKYELECFEVVRHT